MAVAADAMRLWRRLEEDRPIGPWGPVDGFADDVIRIAKKGRCHVQISMERGPTSAQSSWRSVMRSNQRRGGKEDDILRIL